MAEEALAGVDGFYVNPLGSLRAWAAKPPRLRAPHASPPDFDADEAAALRSNDYSSQDGVSNQSAADQSGRGPAFSRSPAPGLSLSLR